MNWLFLLRVDYYYYYYYLSSVSHCHTEVNWIFGRSNIAQNKCKFIKNSYSAMIHRFEGKFLCVAQSTETV